MICCCWKFETVSEADFGTRNPWLRVGIRIVRIRLADWIANMYILLVVHTINQPKEPQNRPNPKIWMLFTLPFSSCNFHVKKGNFFGIWSSFPKLLFPILPQLYWCTCSHCYCCCSSCLCCWSCSCC